MTVAADLDDRAIVRELVRYDDAKRAYTIAKKLAEADLAKIANEGQLSRTEDVLRRATLREADAALASIRALIGT